MMVWFKIDFHSGKPVYEQIKDGLKDFIASSLLNLGDPIPSVREFARMLNVNVNTVARAYRELELEGIIVSRKGVGYFVNADGQTVRKLLLENVKERIKDPLNKLKRIGFSTEEILNLIRELILEVNEDGSGDKA